MYSSILRCDLQYVDELNSFFISQLVRRMKSKVSGQSVTLKHVQKKGHEIYQKINHDFIDDKHLVNLFLEVLFEMNDDWCNLLAHYVPPDSQNDVCFFMDATQCDGKLYEFIVNFSEFSDDPICIIKCSDKIDASESFIHKQKEYYILARIIYPENEKPFILFKDDNRVCKTDFSTGDMLFEGYGEKSQEF